MDACASTQKGFHKKHETHVPEIVGRIVQKNTGKRKCNQINNRPHNLNGNNADNTFSQDGSCGIFVN